MISLTLAELATHLDAEVIQPDTSVQDCKVQAVSTDSRQVAKDCLFIALKGERFDGHDFVAVAETNGAKALLVSQVCETRLPQLLVSDTLAAMGKMAALVRDRINPICLALTGSNGKTSVKEMLAHILSQDHSVLYTAGNFNNDIGVPLTLLRLESQHEYGVFELGANHKGEIDYTSGLVKPDVALVNNVASAHLEGFGSQDGVAQAKSEIFTHLSPKGCAVINLDDPYCAVMQKAAAKYRMLTFSAKEAADIRATELVSDALGRYRFKLNFQEQSLPIPLPLAGRHQVSNALAASAMCLAIGLKLETVANGLSTLEPVKGRMQPHDLGRVQLIDDSYNANPASVKAAIDWLQEVNSQTYLVLGDLGELGDNAERLHAELGEYAKSQGVDDLFCVGGLSAHTSEAFGSSHYDSFEALVEQLKENIKQSSDVMTVLVKGSRSAKMERVVEALKIAHGQGEFV